MPIDSALARLSHAGRHAREDEVKELGLDACRVKLLGAFDSVLVPVLLIPF